MESKFTAQELFDAVQALVIRTKLCHATIDMNPGEFTLPVLLRQLDAGVRYSLHNYVHNKLKDQPDAEKVKAAQLLVGSFIDGSWMAQPRKPRVPMEEKAIVIVAVKIKPDLPAFCKAKKLPILEVAEKLINTDPEKFRPLVETELLRLMEEAEQKAREKAEAELLGLSIDLTTLI